MLHAGSKLCSYVLYKNNFVCEKYLSVIHNVDIRKNLTRLRVSAHSLKIEKGRYQGIPRHDRTCPRCSSSEIEDELHFRLNCTSLNNERNKLILCARKYCANFDMLTIKDSLFG